MPDTVSAELPQLLPRLRRYALALCPSPAQADDLVQGACERALAQAHMWTPGTRLDAWLFRILRNMWIDSLRRARLEADMQNFPADAEPVLDGERQALSRIEVGEVDRKVRQLPWEQREVLLLVCVDEMSYREAAGLLNVPIGTVMSRLARARRHLLEAHGDTAPERARG